MGEHKGNGRSGSAFYTRPVCLLSAAAAFVMLVGFSGSYARNGYASYTAESGKIEPYTNGRQRPKQAAAGGEGERSVVLTVDKGAVVLTVNNVNEKECTVKIEDAAAAVNIILSEDEKKLASEGEVIEIRMDVEHVENISRSDLKTVMKGMEAGRDKILGLTMGMYTDISVYKRISGGEWTAVHETPEPVQIMIYVPEDLKMLSADFYVIRAHEGEYLLLKDMDDDPERITIETDRFSVYAVAYKLKKEGAGSGICGLCHVCPTFFGICCFVWLAFLVAALGILLLLLRNMEKKEPDEENDEEEIQK